jgi:hypothetical protein
MGDSRGHFEGNTLVVRTTNFNGATGAQANGNLMITSDALEVTEQFTRTGPDTIQYEVTVNDPKTWTKPWTAAFPLKRDPNYRMFEYACHEGTTRCRTSCRGRDLTRNSDGGSGEPGRSGGPGRSGESARALTGPTHPACLTCSP